MSGFLARRATGRPGDDGGFAMILSILLIVIVAGLSLSMAAVILNQAQPTQESRKRVQTINAAQSGLQVVLLNLRAANDGANNGVLNKVPCTSDTGASFSVSSNSTATTAKGTSFAGSVTAATGTGTSAYRVSVAYFRLDPSGQSPTWLHDNAMPCPLTLVPRYAYLQSYGTGAKVPGDNATQDSRTQTATYEFSTSNINIVGGRMRSFGTQECLDAGLSPVVGTLLTMQPCLALGTARQTWQYRKDLTIFYGGDTSLNLCVQAPSAGNRPVLKTCTGSGSGSTYPYASGQQVQEWGFNDNGHFARAEDSGAVKNDSMCLQPSGAGGSTAAASGADVVYVGCDGNTSGPAAFDPDPQVGAGKAGGSITGLPGATKQYVNYAQFGRCLDVTSGDVNSTFLIAYPCKQAPNPTQLLWNQVWDYSPGSTGYGNFYTTKPDGVRYCLTAPTSGNYIVTKVCGDPLIVAARQQWRATGMVTGNYGASYTLVSQLNGNCMAAGQISASTGFASASILSSPCDGTAEQKWNAPPVDPTSSLSNLTETTGG